MAEAADLLRTFEPGDSLARVLAVQGVPDDLGATLLRYGSSVVYFKEGRVTGWSDGFPRLHVRMLPGLDFDLLATFSLGSSRFDVSRIQGRPTDEMFGAYFYGSSVVYFDHDRVARWIDRDPSLRLPLLGP